MDSVTALGVAMKDLSVRRRAAIKKAIPALSSVSWAKSEPTEWLYGNDISDQIKAVKTAQNLQRGTSTSSRKRRPNSGYFAGNYSGNYSRQSRDKRTKPSTLNYRAESRGTRSAGPRRKAPPEDRKSQ